MPIKSHTTGTAMMAEDPGGARVLAVEIVIDCPACGQATYWFRGHHLRVMRALLDEFIELYPDLCGDDAGLQVIRRDVMAGRANDPERS